MNLKKYFKYLNMLEQLKKDKGTLIFRVDGENNSNIYKLEIEGGKIPKGNRITEASNSLNEVLTKAYDTYKNERWLK